MQCDTCTRKSESWVEKEVAPNYIVSCCKECAFWHDQASLDKKDHGMVAICGGMHFRIGPKDAKVKGLSGTVWTLTFNDGRVEETDNLMFQGEVPPWFCTVFTDNLRELAIKRGIQHEQKA